MTKKQGLRAVLFFVVLGMVLGSVIRVFGIPLERSVWNVTSFNEFYEEPRNTWDGVVLGTSCIDRGWAAPLAWNDYGMTVYDLATNGQPMILTTGLLDEIRKTQDVKFAIIDIRGVRVSCLTAKEAQIRRVTDAMKYSVNRQKMVKKVLDFYQDFYTSEEVRSTIGDENEDQKWKELDEESLYVPFLKYHSRWETGLDQSDFVNQISEMKGTFDSDIGPFDVGTVEEPKVCTDVTEKLLDSQKELLDEVIEYGKDTGLEILFVSMPVFTSKENQIELNNINHYLEEKGATVLNFNTEEKYKEVGLVFSEDFYNKHHMNSRGAMKFTKYLAGYLSEHYEFEDKRGREEYQDWDAAYEKYVKFYEEGWELYQAAEN